MLTTTTATNGHAVHNEDLPRFLDLELDPPIEWNNNTYERLHLEEPTAHMVERAEAVVAAAQFKYAPAEDQFKKAIATFQHYCLPWEEADTLQYWGRALLAAGEHARAIEKFDAAIEIYRSHGAGVRSGSAVC